MTAAAATPWVARIVRRLPAPVLAALDAWSRGIAHQRAERRRRAAQARR